MPSNDHGETTVEVDGIEYTVRRMSGNVPGNSYTVGSVEGRRSFPQLDLTTNDPVAVTWAVRGYLAGYKEGDDYGRTVKGREIARTLRAIIDPS